MSNKKLAGILGGCIVVVVVIVIIATLGPRPVTDYSTLLRYLRDSGASIEEKGEMHQSAVFNLFDVEGKRVTVNGSSIYVFEYANAVAMELEASCVSPDGFGMTKGNTAEQISWINPPHFYKAGRIIVFYCGYNESIGFLCHRPALEVLAGEW